MSKRADFMRFRRQMGPAGETAGSRAAGCRGITSHRLALRYPSMDYGLLLIDAQEHFQPPRAVLARLERLLMFWRMVSMPVVATFEQDKGELPKGLELPPQTQRFEKAHFDANREAAIREALSAHKSWAVAGAETDVCVLQSVLGLLAHGHEVRLLEDCLFSSEANPEPAIARMRAPGAIPCTFKTLAYEIVGTVDRATWPAEWDQGLFPPPEDLPFPAVSP